MYIYKTTVRLHHTDAAGILFFGRIYELINEAYESMMLSIGQDVRAIIFKTDFILPFVHTEADYRSPLTVGDEIEIRIETEKLGTTSMSLVYHIMKTNGTEAVTARTVSVSVERKSFTKIPLPDPLRKGLESL